MAVIFFTRNMNEDIRMLKDQLFKLRTAKTGITSLGKSDGIIRDTSGGKIA